MNSQTFNTALHMVRQMALALALTCCSEQVCQEQEVPEDRQSSGPGDLPDDRSLNGCDVMQGTLEPVELKDLAWDYRRDDYSVELVGGTRVTAYITGRGSDECPPT
jgi:hypothetical protein